MQCEYIRRAFYQLDLKRRKSLLDQKRIKLRLLKFSTNEELTLLLMRVLLLLTWIPEKDGTQIEVWFTKQKEEDETEHLIKL